jgi:Asp-tRNA(Asn)/Glu-tRNA(Gln) amidotransferase A subunit family amidase
VQELQRELEREEARVESRESVVRAWVTRHPAAHLRAAAADLPPGPLQGWTVGVKDVIDTADLPTERGSPIYAGRTTINDAACVALARRAGALVAGKTTTTEFALFSPTATTNPHNPDHTPGGSSSGSAAAVADGMVRAAFGTQTVGSVIRPAAFCGVVGFKPTHQLVPIAGVAPLSPSFDTVGWMTRSVADAQALLAAMTGLEPRTNTGRLRIGCYQSRLWPSAQPELAGVLDGAAGALDDAGFDVVDLAPLPHLDGLFDAADTVFLYEVWRTLAWECAHRPEQISPLVAKMLQRAEAIDAAAHAEAQAVLADARTAHRRYLASAPLDALLTPSAPGEAPALKTTGDSVFNRTWTALGVPAVQLPTGTGPLGLPVGVQLTGTTWADADLLAVAARAEAVWGCPRSLAES